MACGGTNARATGAAASRSDLPRTGTKEFPESYLIDRVGEELFMAWDKSFRMRSPHTRLLPYKAGVASMSCSSPSARTVKVRKNGHD